MTHEPPDAGTPEPPPESGAEATPEPVLGDQPATDSSPPASEGSAGPPGPDQDGDADRPSDEPSERDRDVPSDTALSRRVITRTNDRRVLAGVGSGLGDYLDVSPWIPRLVFIFLTPFGFLGPLAYAAAWVLIRREDEQQSIAERAWDRLRTGQNWLGALLVFVAALIIIASFDFLQPGLVFAVGLLVLGVLLYRENIGGTGDSSNASETVAMTSISTSAPSRTERPPRPVSPPRPPRPPRDRSPLGRWTVGMALLVVGAMAAVDIAGASDFLPRHYAAALLAVIGSGLVIGAFVGRARWLIAPGLLLLPIVVASSFVEIPFDGSVIVESITVTPSIQSDVLDRYDIETGEFTLDLSAVDFTSSDSVIVDMAAGELRIVLPVDLETVIDARVGVGAISGIAGNSEGIGITRTTELQGSDGPLELEIELGAGELRIVRGGES